LLVDVVGKDALHHQREFFVQLRQLATGRTEARALPGSRC
jgi:hypothetical protein